MGFVAIAHKNNVKYPRWTAESDPSSDVSHNGLLGTMHSLQLAALEGSEERIVELLSTGLVDIDQRDIDI